MLAWPCLSLREKRHSINHVIVFNDPINKFYQCSICGFCRGISMSFSICPGKKNIEVIKFLGIVTKCAAKNKIYFCLKKKSNVSLNKKVICLSHNFQTWFYNADHLLYYLQMSVFSFHTFFVLLEISVSKKWNRETILTFSYTYNWQK